MWRFPRGTADQLDAAAKDIRHLSVRTVTIQADLFDAADCVRVVEKTVEEFGRIDVLDQQRLDQRSLSRKPRGCERRPPDGAGSRQGARGHSLLARSASALPKCWWRQDRLHWGNGRKIGYEWTGIHPITHGRIGKLDDSQLRETS